jgi:hypothetical protein
MSRLFTIFDSRLGKSKFAAVVVGVCCKLKDECDVVAFFFWCSCQLNTIIRALLDVFFC